MKTTSAFTQGQSLIVAILNKMEGIDAWRRRFLVESVMLFLLLRGRINFLQMGRHGQYNESTYRRGFNREFKFLEFNNHLIKDQCSEEVILGFDPSYINKSGKQTPGLGYYYSGSAGRYKKGIEIGSIGAVDLSQNTAYHLEAIQTPSGRKHQLANGQSLVDHYADIIVSKGEALERISKILAVDGYFAKRNFIEPVSVRTHLRIVCRLRDDANLRYLYHGKQEHRRGRPKQYDGKINVRSIDKRRIKKEYEDDEKRIYSAVVNSVGLKRNIKLAYVEFLDVQGQVMNFKLFFSTDLEMTGINILKYYRSRFQIEFLFRDSKGYTGLEHCQARSPQKIYFHINASLTAASIAKCIQRIGIDKKTRISYSIADIKTELFNYFLLKRIFSIYRIDQNIKENNNVLRSILNFGKIAA
jgi:hypothetical protein